MDLEHPDSGEVMSVRSRYLRNLLRQVEWTGLHLEMLEQDLEELIVELESENGVYRYDETAATLPSFQEYRRLRESEDAPSEAARVFRPRETSPTQGQ